MTRAGATANRPRASGLLRVLIGAALLMLLVALWAYLWVPQGFGP
jgi:hypothetical protein